MKRWLGLFSILFLVLVLTDILGAFDFNKFRPKNRSKFSTHQPVAVAAVRGLDEPAGESGDTNTRDEASIAWLESQNTTSADIASFATEGGLLP